MLPVDNNIPTILSTQLLHDLKLIKNKTSSKEKMLTIIKECSSDPSLGEKFLEKANRGKQFDSGAMLNLGFLKLILPTNLLESKSIGEKLSYGNNVITELFENVLTDIVSLYYPFDVSNKEKENILSENIKKSVVAFVTNMRNKYQLDQVQENTQYSPFRTTPYNGDSSPFATVNGNTNGGSSLAELERKVEKLSMKLKALKHEVRRTEMPHRDDDVDFDMKNMMM